MWPGQEQPYAPQEYYPRPAATAPGFDGWSHQQYGGGVNLQVLPQHMLPQGHMHPAAATGHPGMLPPAMSANQSPAAMVNWMPQAAALQGMRPPAAAPAAGARVGPGVGRGSWLGSSSSSNAFSRGAAAGGRHTPVPASRGARVRRSFVLNTKPGDFSDAAVDAFARSVRRPPAAEQLDAGMLAAGLQHLDSRGLAALLKELARSHHSHRAREVFDFLRALPETHALSALCDVFTYTAMVSLCVDQQELPRALELVAEMRQRNVERNVHTYTALMNVAIKCGQLQKALEIYNDMLREGCTPNVVTYNTLIDVFGKTGQWGEALRVIDTMNASGTKPVTRTYNTLMIACNTSGQWQEALNVYAEMMRLGHAPNTTTYNALISAYSKAGRLEKVMDSYQQMLHTGCERSVITYSALISACEKAGQWQLALNLFSEMLRERCTPNVITYNSLITACAQGAQWQKAAEVFQQMQSSGCRPDVVTFTALVSAFERGGQWMKALEAFQQMQALNCSADAILYNTLLDVLWDTGVTWAQHRAAQLFRRAVAEGHFRRLPQPLVMEQQQQQPADAAASNGDSGGGSASAVLEPGSSNGGSPRAAAAAAGKLELGLQGASPGVAMLMLHCWLADLRDFVLQQREDEQQQQQQQQQQQRQGCCLPERLVLSNGRSRARDHVSGILRDSTVALLCSLGCPFVAAGPDASSNSKLEAAGQQLEEWLLQDRARDLLCGFSSSSTSGSSAQDSQAQLAAEAALAQRCREEFGSVKTFEDTHNLSVQSMGDLYSSARAGMVRRMLEAGQQLGLRDDLAHDAVLLMDRGMSASFEVTDESLPCLAAACLHLTAGAALGAAAPALPDVCAALGCSSQEAEAMAVQLTQLLKQDTSAISALRCLKLYLQRLGLGSGPHATSQDVQHLLELVTATVQDSEFLNYRPTITAAAVLYCVRLQKGQLPFWPSSLASLTGYSNARTPELAAAINGAQRLCKQLASEDAAGSEGGTSQAAAGGHGD